MGDCCSSTSTSMGDCCSSTTMFNLLAATLQCLVTFFCSFCKLSTTFSFPLQPLAACGIFLPGTSPNTFLDALVTLFPSKAEGMLETSEKIRKAITFADIILVQCVAQQRVV